MFHLSTVLADTAWYADPDRMGEGIVLSELDNGGLAFAFYAHVEEYIDIPPTVSPPPPPVRFCDIYNIWLIGVSELYADGIAFGDVYYNDPDPLYPLAVNGTVAEEVKVGTFVIYKSGEGFVLHMENNHTMCGLSLFGVDHYFSERIAD